MDGLRGDGNDPDLEAYLDALRRQLVDSPSELTERRHLRAVMAATTRTRRRLFSHGAGRVAVLGIAAVLIALNGSVFADALPSARDLTTGLGRAVHVVFDRSSAETGWPYESPVVTLPEQIEDPEVRTGATQPEQQASQAAPAAPTPTPDAPGDDVTAAPAAEPEVDQSGLICERDRTDGDGAATDDDGSAEQQPCTREWRGDDRPHRWSDQEGTRRDGDRSGDERHDRDGTRRDRGDRDPDGDGSRWSDRHDEWQGGNR